MEGSFSAVLLLLVVSTVGQQAPSANNTLKFRPVHIPLPSDSPSLYIVNGEVAAQGSLPWQVSVQEYSGGNFFWQQYRLICGGSIISARVVVTAAHCITSGRFYRIVAGVNRLDDSTSKLQQIREVQRAIVHPAWNEYSLENDVAVLLLSDALVVTSTVKPIPMARWNENIDITEPCVASGWGDLSQGGPVAQELMNVDLNIMPTNQCNRAYRNVINITIDQRRVCAGGHDGKAACNGDSGGPLVCKNGSQVNVLTGITSFGVICGDEHPTVFTSVAYFNEWISSLGSSSSSTTESLTIVLTTLFFSTVFSRIQ